MFKLYHICGGKVYVDDSTLHVDCSISIARHERYRRFYARDGPSARQISVCPGCGRDLLEAERAGLLQSFAASEDTGKAIRAWQRAVRRAVRPGRQPPAGDPTEGIPVLASDEGPYSASESDRASGRLFDIRRVTCYNKGEPLRTPTAERPTTQLKEKPTVTTTAPSAPADQPAAPSPPARTLLAQLTGQSKAGQTVKVTLEESTSPAKTVFLTIMTDGETAPPEKFLGVQKARAHARLAAIKKDLQGAKLDRFDEPEPEPAPTPTRTFAAGLGQAGKASGKASGKPAPPAPTAPTRTRDQVTVIKELGCYRALMIVGPSSRYEVWKDHGLATAERLWDVKATRAWQPQQRAAKDKVDELYKLDPSPRPEAPPTEPAPEPVATAKPTAATELVVGLEPAVEYAPEPTATAEPGAKPAARRGKGKPSPMDGGPAL